MTKIGENVLVDQGSCRAAKRVPDPSAVQRTNKPAAPLGGPPGRTRLWLGWSLALSSLACIAAIALNGTPFWSLIVVLGVARSGLDFLRRT